MAPSNPLRAPGTSGPWSSGGSDSVPLSSGMVGTYMPRIPNLELGFQYFFGNKVRSGQASADYLFPVIIGNDAVLFGEAHGNYWNFGLAPTGGASNRVDLSFGGGARKVYSNQLLLGVNGFYDTSRLFNRWYSSGGAGMEIAANIGTTDAVDLNANWYGNLFSSNYILNAFRNKGNSFDIQAGYSHAMFDSALDLRVKLAGYQLDVGNPVRGYMTGADLTTRDGMFTLRYEYGNDKVNGSWNNIGAFINIGFQMENIIKGESPVTMPEPIFKSPRNLRRMLTQRVKRDWNQQYAPGRAALASAAVGGCALSRNTEGGAVPASGNLLQNFFAPVDPAELNPNLYVTVTFSYTNTSDASSIYLDVASVDGGPYVLTDYVAIPGNSSGIITVQLCRTQHEFVSLNGQPWPPYVFESYNDYPSNSVTITDVIICFNQPDTGGCP
ncbi:MAG: hypothetical protein ACLQMS_07235 [Desulfomonilaceae bacterium]